LFVRLLALSLVGVIFSAPVVTRTRMFCRFTGVELTARDCSDASASDSAEVRADLCCDTRIQTALPLSRFEPLTQSAALALTPSVELSWFQPFLALAPQPTASPPAPRTTLSATRVLLI
jgi:hypothetical protein